MKKIAYILTISFFFLFLADNANGQGCSDAGLCTMDSFKPGHTEDTRKTSNRLKAGVFFGSADHSISVFGNYLEYSRQFGEKLGITAKITTLGQSGNDISVFGISDIFLNGDYALADNVRITLGAKIPLNSAGQSKDGLPLPMDYQSSLGTFDIVFGFGFGIEGFQIVAAMQQPLTHNENEFISGLYPAESKISEIQSTNEFKRSGDIMLRLSYPIDMGENLRLTPGILPIYHLANDKYTDASGNEKEITGSQGLTFNGNLYLDYAIDDTHTLQLNIAMPFLVRDARPDGLTRSFLANLEYILSF